MLHPVQEQQREGFQIPSAFGYIVYRFGVSGGVECHATEIGALVIRCSVSGSELCDARECQVLVSGDIGR
jgi:hypothetical protein